MFDLERFVADCRAALAEGDSGAITELMRRTVAAPGAIMAALGEPTEAASATLFHTPDITILNLAWAPYHWTLPHNHNVRAVIGMYTGGENNMLWRRLPDDPSRVEAAGAKALRQGDVAVLGKDIIHSVTNPLGKISAALHVYEGDFFAPGRSMWDAETLAQAPYDRARNSPMFTRR